jgi:hypothetical protein
MFRRDDETGEEIAHLVTTPNGYTIVSAFPHMYEDNPDYTVDEVRGHTEARGFIVDRTVD